VLLLCYAVAVLQLFSKVLREYDVMRKRNAYLVGFQKEKMFSDNLYEFDNAREVVASLIDEYKAAETPDYLKWGTEEWELESEFAAGVDDGLERKEAGRSLAATAAAAVPGVGGDGAAGGHGLASSGAMAGSYAALHGAARPGLGL